MFINVHFKKVHHLHKKLLYEEYLYSKCFPLLDKLRNWMLHLSPATKYLFYLFLLGFKQSKIKPSF